MLKAWTVRVAADGFTGKGHGFGEAVLRLPRGALRTFATEAHQRKDDEGNDGKDQTRSLGEVMNIIAPAPTHRMVLRSASDAVAPTVDLIWVVSAVSRETISPERVAS